jgi:hypothetical protein
MKRAYSTLAAIGASIVAVFSLLVLTQCGFNRPAVNDSAFQKPKIDHANFTASCVSCHEATRPPPVDVIPHGSGQDCAVCHRYITADPIWKSFSQFSHVPAPTACIPCHGSLRPKANPHPDTKADCVSCHAFPKFYPPINK